MSGEKDFYKKLDKKMLCDAMCRKSRRRCKDCSFGKLDEGIFMKQPMSKWMELKPTGAARIKKPEIDVW